MKRELNSLSGAPIKNVRPQLKPLAQKRVAPIMN